MSPFPAGPDCPASEAAARPQAAAGWFSQRVRAGAAAPPDPGKVAPNTAPATRGRPPARAALTPPAKGAAVAAAPPAEAEGAARTPSHKATGGGVDGMGARAAPRGGIITAASAGTGTRRNGPCAAAGAAAKHSRSTHSTARIRNFYRAPPAAGSDRRIGHAPPSAPRHHIQ